MRPRLITAENAPQGDPQPRPAAGFNEAAAHHRGELGGRGRFRFALCVLQ